MKRCLAVFGPTASGKTSLAIALAKELDGVIISADSMQIYKEMNVGTAKPSQEEQQAAPHRLIDFLSPSEPFSVYDYKRLAESEIEKALADKKVPIIAGGTGLYFDALFQNTDFGDMQIPSEIRQRLEEEADEKGCEVMLEELRRIDPNSAAPLHVRDRKRILRALEVYRATGKTLSLFKSESHSTPSKYEYKKFFLTYADREALYRRINLRVDQMMENGLLEETNYLYQSGFLCGDTARQAIGYKELLPYLQGEKDLFSCVDTLKQKTRNYAKRQLTWFRRYTDATVIEMDREIDPIDTVIQTAKHFLRRSI